jgi:hypothetical protein
MAWTGYVGYGTTDSTGAFTEASVAGYARRMFSFNSPIAGRLQAAGNVVWFPRLTTPVTYNAFAFYDAVTGGNRILTYPLDAPVSHLAGESVTLNPYSIVVNLVDQMSATGQQLDMTAVCALAGVTSHITANMPNLAAVATSGSYADLTGQPDLLAKPNAMKSSSALNNPIIWVGSGQTTLNSGVSSVTFDYSSAGFTTAPVVFANALATGDIIGNSHVAMVRTVSATSAKVNVQSPTILSFLGATFVAAPAGITVQVLVVGN